MLRKDVRPEDARILRNAWLIPAGPDRAASSEGRHGSSGKSSNTRSGSPSRSRSSSGSPSGAFLHLLGSHLVAAGRFLPGDTGCSDGLPSSLCVGSDWISLPDLDASGENGLVLFFLLLWGGRQRPTRSMATTTVGHVRRHPARPSNEIFTATSRNLVLGNFG